jgi:hypothetical protein
VVVVETVVLDPPGTVVDVLLMVVPVGQDAHETLVLSQAAAPRARITAMSR